jgi:polyisoprenoid-binding protein YceI
MQRTTVQRMAAAAMVVFSLLLLGNGSGFQTRAQTPAPGAQTATVPLTGTWTIDLLHSNVNFAIKHLGISTVRGRFDDFAGTIVADAADPKKWSVDVTIQTASINTGIKMRDDHLRNADFFDVEKYPQITFKSTRVEKRRGGFVARGTLTMHGVSKEITLPFTVAGPIKDPRTGGRIGIETRVRLNRQDYGLKYHQVLDNGALALANDVDIEIGLEATPAKSTASR